jgi:hypothetical protein
MRRLASILTALAFAASLSSFAVAKPHDNMGGGMGMGNSYKHKCPPGKHWVKGYTNKKGVKVKGYCR